MLSIEEILKEIEIRDEHLPQKKETYYKTLLSFRDYYQAHEKEIIILSKTHPHTWYESYPIDWSTVLTPIEMEIWDIIRSTGRIVMYPQYPVLNYFVDFANPGKKIIVEVDGKDYHTDKDKDYLRDQELYSKGWKVFRISGAEAYKQVEYDEDEEGDDYVDWVKNTGEGIIWAMRQIFFENYDGQHRGLYETTLSNHSSFYKR
jgi:hypothetical protein